ncbi:MAG: hypothetical protein E4G90_06765 [Gemmatimonadales bacterium]|nr:MAG: hypothetical protein E4G90_06765 [Gemmatimonadales bacterium]
MAVAETLNTEEGARDESEGLVTEGASGPARSTVAELATVLVRYLWVLIGVPILSAVLALGLGYLLGARYVSTTVLQPQLSSVDPSGVASLAAQFGVSLGAASGGETLDFYVILLRSRAVLEEIAQDEFLFAVDEAGTEFVRGHLIDLLEIDEELPGDRLKEAVAWLEDAIRVSSDADASLVTIEVTTPSVGMSEAVGRTIIDEVNEFNLGKRQNHARQERVFIEERMTRAREELENEERAMESFLESNRTFESSPQLTFEHQRILRRLDVRQQVYLSLSQAFEQARIEEVRNTPVFTVIESPEGSAEIETSLPARAVFGFVAGLLAALFAIGVREAVLRYRSERPDEFRYLVGLLRAR